MASQNHRFIINLPPDAQNKLCDLARGNGGDPGAIATELLLSVLANADVPACDQCGGTVMQGADVCAACSEDT